MSRWVFGALAVPLEHSSRQQGRKGEVSRTETYGIVNLFLVWKRQSVTVCGVDKLQPDAWRW